MPTQAMFTLHDIWQFIMAFSAAIVTIAGAIGAIIKWVNKAKEPTEKLAQRIDEHDIRLDAHEEHLSKINQLLGKDKMAIDEINEGNRVTQKALLAIMEQLLTGGPTDSLREAKDELQSFLINK